MKLSNEQIHAFERDGFLLLPQFVQASRCDAIKVLALKHLEAKIEPIESEEEYLLQDNTNKTVRRLRQVYDREESFREWMTDDGMRDILKQLLGDKPVLLLAHHNSIMTKLPKVSSITSWHQDIRYWHYSNDELLSVWLSFGDEYLENGLLEFIPGSHKMIFTPDQFDEQASFRSDLEKNQDIISKRVHFELHKGDVVLFHAKTLHYAHLNDTNEAKLSFVYSLRSASNQALKNTRSDFKELELS